MRRLRVPLLATEPYPGQRRVSADACWKDFSVWIAKDVREDFSVILSTSVANLKMNRMIHISLFKALVFLLTITTDQILD